MKFVNNVKNLQIQIEDLLINHPYLRDSDEKLVANIWAKNLKNKQGVKCLDSLSARDVLMMFAKRELSSFESITRARRKIQEKNENTRGSTWKMRHKEEIDTRKNINKI